MNNSNKKDNGSPKSVVGKSSIWRPTKFSLRQYGLVLAGLLVLAGGILIFASTGSNPQNPNNIQIGVMGSQGWGPENSTFIKNGGVTWDRMWASNSSGINAALNGGGGYPGGYSVMIEVKPDAASAMAAMNQYKGYGSRVVFEFGNESYLTNSGNSMTAGAYATAYQQAYNQKHAAGITQPLIFMTTGDQCWSGLAVDPCIKDSSGNYNVLYLEKALATVPNLQVDAFSTHTYGGAHKDTNNHANGVDALIYQHQDAVNHGFTNTPWYVSEWGVNLNSNTTDCFYARSYADQATCITSAYQQMMGLPWLKQIMYYESHDDSTGWWGLITAPHPSGKDGAGEPAGCCSASGSTPINPRPSWNALLAFLPSGGTTPPPDTTPPTVSFTAPAANATVKSVVTVSANASDNVGVSNVQFKLDGASLGSPAGTPPYSLSWDTTKATNGTHTLTALATDTAGNTSTATETVTVNNAVADTTPPSVPAGLAAKAVTSAEIDVSWSASTDNVGVTSYRLYRNGTLLAMVAAPTVTYKDVAVSAATTYTYTVSASDLAGNVSAQSASVSASTPAAPDKTAPTTPTGLKSTATTQTTIALSWNASTDSGGSGLAGYHVYRNNTLVASPTGTTFTDSGLAPGTSYTYAVSAYDNAANGSTASTPLTVSTAASTGSTYVQNLSWDAAARTIRWSAYSGAAGYKIAIVQNPTTTRNTTYTTLQNTGTSYVPPVMSNTTVHYGIIPQIKNANGSYSDMPGTTWAPEISVTWSNVVQNFTWDASTHTLRWSAYQGAYGYKIATVKNPSTTRNTTYTYPPVTGTSWTPPTLSGQTVHYGIIPQVQSGSGYADFPGATWAPEVSVTWPNTGFLGL